MNDNEYSNYGIHASVRNFKSSFRNFFFFFFLETRLNYWLSFDHEIVFKIVIPKVICVPILVYRTKKDRLRKDHLHYLQALSMILTSVNNMKTRELKSRVRTNADQQYQMKEISLWWSFMLLKKLPVQYFDDFFFVTWNIHAFFTGVLYFNYRDQYI